MNDLLLKPKVAAATQLPNVGIKATQVSVIRSFCRCNYTKLLVSAVFKHFSVSLDEISKLLDTLTEHFPSSHDLRCDINATNSLLNLASSPRFNNRFSEWLRHSSLVGEKYNVCQPGWSHFTPTA